MTRISARCPLCGAGIGPSDVSVRAFRCRRCSAWLRVPFYQDAFRGVVALLLAGFAAYLLGLRGLPLLIASLFGIWIVGNPVCVVLDRLLPLRPKRTWPDGGYLGLGGAGAGPPAKEAQGDVGQGAGNTSEVPRPPPKSEA